MRAATDFPCRGLSGLLLQLTHIEILLGALDEGVESIEVSEEAGNAQHVDWLIVADKLFRYGLTFRNSSRVTWLLI